jgi:hypothetical protein
VLQEPIFRVFSEENSAEKSAENVPLKWEKLELSAENFFKIIFP